MNRNTKPKNSTTNNPSPPLFSKLLKVVPPVLTLLLVALLAVSLRDLSLEGFLNFVPQNPWLAAVVILVCYGVKSLSVVVPLSLLYLAAGFLYPFWIALPLSYAGLVVCCTLPYLLGRKWGQQATADLLERYPKAQRFFALGLQNQVLVSYLLRIVGVLPGDLCSLVLGACGTSYPSYLAGSLLGLSPVMILHLLAVHTVSNGFEPWLLIPAALLVAVTVVSSVLLNRRTKAHPPQQPPTVS